MFCVTYKLENIFLPAANNHRVKYWIRSLVQCQVVKTLSFYIPAVLGDYHSSS